MADELVTDDVLDHFIASTGVDADVARRCLLDHKCDLIGALKAHERQVFASLSAQQPRRRRGHQRNPSMVINNNTMTKMKYDVNKIDEVSDECSSDDGESIDDCTMPTSCVCAQSTSQHLPAVCHIETPSYTFTLPDLSVQPRDFRAFLEKDLIEMSALKGLENSGQLNWWVKCSGENGDICERLFPLSTSGDGNCLLHAASLGMWGFHDRLLILRNALHALLTKGARRHALWRRWRWQQTRVNEQSGLVYSEQEWAAEWRNLVRLASAEPRIKVPSEKAEGELEPAPVTHTYESLEDIHVFALAHVLKRPIVVIADTVLRSSSGEALAPIPFGGIYLPLECKSVESHRAPLVLCYDAAHFSALVAMAHNEITCCQPLLPITTSARRLLPVHFASDPGADFTWWRDDTDAKIARRAALTEAEKLNLVCRYMDIASMKTQRRGSATLPTSASTPSGLALSGLGTGLMPQATRIQRLLRDRISRRYRKSHRASAANSCDASPNRVGITMSLVESTDQLVCARLQPHAHHQYMQEMLETYLANAKKRFDEQMTPKDATDVKEVQRATLRRERGISRALGSSEDLVVECMNGHCARPASHSTNYLCDTCFVHQQEVMASFTSPLSQPWSPGHSKSSSCASEHHLAPNATSTSLVTIGEDTRAYNSQNYNGVTRYIAVDGETLECRSALCANYSNGCALLCPRCARR